MTLDILATAAVTWLAKESRRQRSGKRAEKGKAKG
jgi:hypothetical protein